MIQSRITPTIFSDMNVMIIEWTTTTTINSKGISCFPKAQHGSVAGVILFFTAAGAALGPLAMGAVSDAFGHNAQYGFILATVFAALLFTGVLVNLIFNPTKLRLQKLDESEY